jgi:hypothetical protein
MKSTARGDSTYLLGSICEIRESDLRNYVVLNTHMLLLLRAIACCRLRPVPLCFVALLCMVGCCGLDAWNI